MQFPVTEGLTFLLRSNMELPVVNIEGKDTGRKATLADQVFGMEEPNDHAIYLDVKQILANQRQGTSKAKERGEIAGSKKKPYRQKGTGSARAGSKKSPLWRKGGTIFGPRPRNYNFKLNKKLKSLARASALTYKARENSIQLVEKFSFDTPKTKEFVQVLENLSVQGKKVLFLLPDQDQNVYLSGRNLKNAKVLRAADVNTFDVLHADQVFIVEDAVEIVNQIR